MMQLTGKVAVVTGAASGIGEAVARQFLEAGARVVAVDWAEGLASVLADASSRFPEHLRCVRGDVAREETARDYVKVAIESFGRIDVVVNCAGVSVVKAIHEHSPEEWDRVFDVNVKALYQCARAVVPVMKQQGTGLFLNTGSISSVVGIPTQGAYGPSKGAVIQVTRQMAIEYAKDGIRSNAICPGTVDTPMLRKAAADSGDPEAFIAGLAAGHPVGRISTADEIAKFYVFVASDDARFLNGSILMIDGGFTAM